MNLRVKSIEARVGRPIALLLLSLMACLAGVNAYAQDVVLPSQDLTQWVDGAELSAISVYKEFTSDEEIDPFPNEREIIGLGITGNVQLKGTNSLVRVILVDDELNEYLVYEAYPLISPNQSFPISNACRETCVLPLRTPSALKIELIDAAIQIQSVVVNLATQLPTSMTAVPPGKMVSVDEVKQVQETEIIQLLNKQIAARGMRWVAGETSISRLSYSEKKALFGRDTLPNLQGFDYYIRGIFEVRNGGDLGNDDNNQSAFVESFDWRSRHGANNPDSPYYDGDETGSGWITSVKRQLCADCWAYSAVGAVEAQANIYFNQHIDLDLSEQQMVSCSGAGSCSGGNPGGALAYITNAGVVDELCFPSSGTDEPCANMCPVPDELIQITAYHTVPRNSEDTLKGSIIEYGPIAFGISSWWHCMVGVGYERDTLDGGTIWILKNSWGTGWGENGYGYIKVPLNDVYLTYAVESPVTSVLSVREVACHDKDGDGYFNWGISLIKPATCPSSAPTVNDCNDSDPEVALQKEDGSCTAPETLVVDIDIKPHDERNVVNPRAKGGIWVAILSDTNAGSLFDPSSQVDISTVEFGPDGAKVVRHKVKDIDKDGLGDLLLRFKIPETGIACGDTEATLIGKTVDGVSFTGTDSIKTVGCEAKKCQKREYHTKYHDDECDEDKNHHGEHGEKKHHEEDDDDDHKSW